MGVWIGCDGRRTKGVLLLCPIGGTDQFYLVPPVRGETLQEGIIGCLKQVWEWNMCQNGWLEQDPDCCALPPESAIPGVQMWHISQREFGHIHPSLLALAGKGGDVAEQQIRRWVRRKVAGSAASLEALCLGGETPELFAKRVEWLAMDRGIIRTAHGTGNPEAFVSGRALFYRNLAGLLSDHDDPCPCGNTSPNFQANDKGGMG